MVSQAAWEESNITWPGYEAKLYSRHMQHAQGNLATQVHVYMYA